MRFCPDCGRGHAEESPCRPQPAALDPISQMIAKWWGIFTAVFILASIWGHAG